MCFQHIRPLWAHTLLNGGVNPLSRYRNTNAIYFPEGTSHFSTVRGGTGIPETILKAFLSLWSSITIRRHAWGWVPTPPHAFIGWYYPRTLFQTPTIGALTPRSWFVCIFKKKPLSEFTLSIYLHTIPVPRHTCCGWMLFRLVGWGLGKKWNQRLCPIPSDRNISALLPCRSLT